MVFAMEKTPTINELLDELRKLKEIAHMGGGPEKIKKQNLTIDEAIKLYKEKAEELEKEEKEGEKRKGKTLKLMV